MKNVLEQWHNDPSVSSIEYTRMAWSGGMRNSQAYDDLEDNERLATEFRDQVESLGTTAGISPLGINTCP